MRAYTYTPIRVYSRKCTGKASHLYYTLIHTLGQRGQEVSGVPDDRATPSNLKITPLLHHILTLTRSLALALTLTVTLALALTVTLALALALSLIFALVLALTLPLRATLGSPASPPGALLIAITVNTRDLNDLHARAPALTVTLTTADQHQPLAPLAPLVHTDDPPVSPP